jgi:hypothetical protein
MINTTDVPLVLAGGIPVVECVEKAVGCGGLLADSLVFSTVYSRLLIDLGLGKLCGKLNMVFGWIEPIWEEGS